MSIESSSIHFGMGGGSGAVAVDAIPFRILAVGDFSREGREVGAEEPAVAHRVDKDSFDSLFAKLSPRLLFEVPNLLLSGGEDIVVDLAFGSMKDFEGPTLAAKIAPLAALLKLREDIARQAGEGASPAALADKIHELTEGIPFARDLAQAVRALGESSPGAAPKPAPSAGSAPAPKGSGGVDSILDMIDTGEEEVKAARKGAAESAIGSAISSIAGSASKGGSKNARGAADAMDAWFGQKIGRQLDAVLHHPDFQSMESAWRGLKFLVSRTDFRKGIVIEALAARKKDLRRCLCGEVLQTEIDQPGEIPLGVVLVDCSFDNTAPDIESMNELAVKGELAQAPVIAQAGAEFFGRKTLQGLGSSGSLNELMGGAQFAKFRGLREKDEARWICLSVNRMLLRHPHAAGAAGKSYPESVDEAKGAGLLWGSAIWALGACMARSFAERGWAHFISGPRTGGAVDSLPLRACEVRPGKSIQIPLEASLTEMNIQDLASAGLIPLGCAENHDEAFFTFLPGVCAPKKYSNPKATQEAAMHAILPYQLFASRMSQWLSRALGQVAGAGSAEEIQKGLEGRLRAALAGPGEKPEAASVRVEVSDDEKNPARYQICFDIQPAFKFFNLTPRLLLAVTMAK